MSPLETLLQMDVRCRLPASNLLRGDKLAMAHGVEMRTPFLDFRIAEFAATLPPDLKLGPQSDTQKFILRQALRNHGILSPERAQIKKQPFCAPVDDWLRDKDHLPDNIRDIMEFKHPLFEDVLDPTAADKLTRGFIADSTTPFTDVRMIDRFWNLCILAVWYDQLLKGFAYPVL